MLKINGFYEKEIISINDGSRLGEIYDIEIDEATGRIISLIITGKRRFFGLFGKREPIIIPWDDVRIIGDEIVLVDSKYEFDKLQNNNIIKNFLD